MRCRCRCHRLTGDQIQPHHWDAFYQWYLTTVDKKMGRAYLTRDFFSEIGRTMANRILLVVATRAGADGSPELIAGALNLIGSHALYGRNWGCDPTVDVSGLHFEVCYYQAIEAAIEMGLARVEAGAQGEHKISRWVHFDDG